MVRPYSMDLRERVVLAVERDGMFDRLFEHVSGDPDMEYALIDGTIVSVHQKATGAKGGLKIRPSGARKAG